MILAVCFFAFGFLVAFLATPWVIRLCAKGIGLDEANETRKRQEVPIPRLGGLPIMLSVSLGLLLVFYDAADAAYVATIPADAPGLRRKTTPETIGQRQSGGAVILAKEFSGPMGAWAVRLENMLEHLDAW